MLVLVMGGIWLFFYYLFTSRDRGPYNRRYKRPNTASDRKIAAVLAAVITLGLFLFATISHRF